MQKAREEELAVVRQMTLEERLKKAVELSECSRKLAEAGRKRLIRAPRRGPA